MRRLTFEAELALRRQSPDPPHQSRRRHQRAEHRAPDDELAPLAYMAPDWREVDPVEDRSGIGPPPFRRRRFEDDVARRFGDIEAGVRCIAKCNSMGGQQPPYFQRPLV